jgi:hypothetical protein
MGYSIFFMTPPLIFIFRNLRKNWWNVGAWISILVSLSLLLMYHNTGAETIGYRYMMDFILPAVFPDGARNRKKDTIGFCHFNDRSHSD